MPTTVYLSLRGDGASRVLEGFRRALGAEAETLVVHPNRDESGYYGSAEVSDVAAAREAFAAARKLYPTLKGFLGVGGREPDETAARPPSGLAPNQRSRPAEQKPRPPERSGEQKARGSERNPDQKMATANGAGREPDKAREKPREKPRPKEETPVREGEAPRQRAPLRRRNRNQRRPVEGAEEAS